MRAYVLETPGGPSALRLRDVPDPSPRDGHVLIRVRAFGLNRAEHFTRRGLSPSVKLPRIIGIECVGEVVQAPGTALAPGQKVVAMMGGMGRAFDGSYAEMTLVPAACVIPVTTDLPWELLGAIPEMFQTTAGSLRVGLEIERAKTLLVRGGTSSIGLTAAVLAKQAGLVVAATTRSADKTPQLLANGADHAIVDDGAIAARVRELFPEGVDRVLELVGTKTLKDSLLSTRPGGIVCMTGILGDSWAIKDFEPMVDIPSGVKLTAYSGTTSDVTPADLQAYVDAIASGRTRLATGRVFAFEELVSAHEMMDANLATGKLVVKVA